MGLEHNAYEDVSTSNFIPITTPAQSRQGARSGSSQTSSPRTSDVNRTNINCGPSPNIAYWITDLALCPVLIGSSIVTAIVRYCDPTLSLNPMALGHKLLNGEGRVICMTQLSPDSWVLL
ncbi:hypothetical protein GQ44DRAFT_764193 [Phaeosphaeriaceae sp. PMI808]|nr:hypothetical protein GQ44DRAFT_764193 [Phaeosphaeriaceae sp. PMI808]